MKQWKHTIKIKHLFEDETTPELIVKLCNELERQLKSILKKHENDWQIYEELEICIDNFIFLRNLADGTIKEDEWYNFSFYGNFEDEFNGYFSQLYDLADTDKLIWID